MWWKRSKENKELTDKIGEFLKTMDDAGVSVEISDKGAIKIGSENFDKIPSVASDIERCKDIELG